MLQHTTWQRVEAQEVCDLAIGLNYKALYNVVSWIEEMRDFITRKLNMKREFSQVIVEKLVHLI